MRKLEYVGQLPRLSTVEKNFLAQLITNPTKEVNVTHTICCQCMLQNWITFTVTLLETDIGLVLLFYDAISTGEVMQLWMRNGSEWGLGDKAVIVYCPPSHQMIYIL
jgi:hypothetical protein